MKSNQSAARSSPHSRAEPAPAKKRRWRRSQVFSSSPARLTGKELDFIDATLLPEQFFTPAWKSRRLWTGERRLLLGVLAEAVRSFLESHSNRTGRDGKLFREAQEWLWSKDRQWLYSFENICAHLQLDPDNLRRGLQRWQQTAEKSRSSTVRNPNAISPTMKISFRTASGQGTRSASRVRPVSTPTKATGAKDNRRGGSTHVQGMYGLPAGG